MKLVLISPKGPLYRHRGGIFKRNLRYAPLTLTTLAAYVPPELNASIEIIDEGVEDVNLNLQADLIGMTVITGSSIRAYELADHFRGRGIPVVLGGPHITLIPDDAQAHADALVVGYAEDTWPELLRDFARGDMKPRYTQSPGLSLVNRPFARRELMKANQFLTTHVFEATRACVHSCDFCVVPTAWGLKPFQKPVEEVVADIRQHWARKIIFIDLNLIAEFLRENGDVFLAHQIEKGQTYSLVVTTGGGLYRYQLHDIIEVTGHWKQAPCIRFVGKADHISDQFGEKLEEHFVANSFAKVFATHGLSPAFAMLAPENIHPSENSPHYTLYLESALVPATLARDIDNALRANFHYDYCRKLGQLGPVQLVQVQNGAETYLRVCQSRGQKLGNIKPAILQKSSGWEQAFTWTVDDRR